MEWLTENLQRAATQLIARIDGPLHFRLLIMPLVVTTLATISGIRDAREGRSGYFRSLLTDKGRRRDHFRRGLLKDVGRVMVMAVIVDSIYQLWQLHTYYPLQVLTVVLVCAVLPYILVRGPVSKIASYFVTRDEPPVSAPDVK